MSEAIEPATPSYGSGIVGLEDVDSTDIAMPILKIDHANGKYIDSLSGESFDDLDVILLGLIKGRIMWPAEVGEGDNPPLCKSYDFEVGHPGEDFPYTAAGLAVAPAEGETLTCATCPLKEWGSNPKGETPWCSEQHTFALLMNPDDEGFGSPAILTVQRSAIKASRAYLSSFARTRQPLFVVHTTLSLDAKRRGSVAYAVPKFVRGIATPEAMAGEYANTYLSIRDFVQTPRVREESDGSGDASATTASAAPRPAPAPLDDDEMPF